MVQVGVSIKFTIRIFIIIMETVCRIKTVRFTVFPFNKVPSWILFYTQRYGIKAFPEWEWLWIGGIIGILVCVNAA